MKNWKKRRSHNLILHMSVPHILAQIFLPQLTRPVNLQSAPTILKNRAPCFLKIGHPALKKNRVQKTKVIVIQKENRQPGLFFF